jgi:hypothetical protein
VHSVEDMNFRVHLQYEFSQLGLDDYLEKLRNTESEELQVRNILLLTCLTLNVNINYNNHRVFFYFCVLSGTNICLPR